MEHSLCDVGQTTLTLKLIALDLGSNMALAHNGFDDVVVTDGHQFIGSRAERATLTLAWLDKRFGEIKKACPGILSVVYERPFARGFDATRCGWGIAGLIEALAGKHEMAVVDQTPQAIKKFATGRGASGKKGTRGNAKKQQADSAMLAAANRMGYLGCDEHEADAYCLLMFALSTAVVTPAPEPKKAKTSGNRKTHGR